MADWGTYIKEIASVTFTASARLLFPPVCAGCGCHVADPGAVCGTCWPKLRFLDQPWCPVMGTPFAADMGEGFLSAEAIADPPPFERARAAVAYTGAAQQMVQRLKYNDRTDLAPWMARWMIRAGFELFPDADVIVPVPLHRRRFFHRRFNQAAELGRFVARSAKLPFDPSVVLRTKLTRQQVGLRRGAREENVRAAFAVPKERRAAIAGKRVLLVDDVFTTGATVSAVARTLKRSGAAAVDVLTFARVLPGDFLLEEWETI
jgi:ComF family protein